MGESELTWFDRLTRLGAKRTSRRQAGLLGASVFAALSAREAASARPKKRKARRESRPRCARGEVACPRCGGLCLPADVACSAEQCPGELCNEVTCGPGEYCCNRSCSRCVPRGHGCTKEACPPQDPGGERCGTAICGEGEYCCNPSCSVCAPRDGGCAAVVCNPDPGDEPCGDATCGRGEYCCNASCSICAPLGTNCIQIVCNPDPGGERCGKNTCGKDEYCCNPSCGICAPRDGGVCTDQVCEPDPPGGRDLRRQDLRPARVLLQPELRHLRAQGAGLPRDLLRAGGARALRPRGLPGW